MLKTDLYSAIKSEDSEALERTSTDAGHKHLNVCIYSPQGGPKKTDDILKCTTPVYDDV